MTKHTKDDCIFCKLANGIIPTTSIYEDEDFNVIMDASPASKGHAIILPKTHAANIYELPDEYCEKLMLVAKKCATAMKESLKPAGINILQNNGEAAGQTVFHLHVHLIPRYDNDNISIGWDHKELPDDPKEVAELIKKALSQAKYYKSPILGQTIQDKTYFKTNTIKAPAYPNKR